MAHQKASVVVTGSSGLIGRAICSSLVNDGYPVAGLDRPGGPNPPDQVDNIPCDLTSDESVSQALAHVRRRFGAVIAAVIHLAAYYDFSGEPSPLYDQVTVGGTHRLLQMLHAFRVEQF